MNHLDWTTTDELHFIRGLGGFSPAGIQAGRLQMLRNYQAHTAERLRWGNIDPVAVRLFVASELKSMERGAKT